MKWSILLLGLILSSCGDSSSISNSFIMQDQVGTDYFIEYNATNKNLKVEGEFTIKDNSSALKSLSLDGGSRFTVNGIPTSKPHALPGVRTPYTYSQYLRNTPDETFYVDLSYVDLRGKEYRNLAYLPASFDLLHFPKNLNYPESMTFSFAIDNEVDSEDWMELHLWQDGYSYTSKVRAAQGYMRLNNYQTEFTKIFRSGPVQVKVCHQRTQKNIRRPSTRGSISASYCKEMVLDYTGPNRIFAAQK